MIVDEFFMEEDESECVHKNINKQKYANNETEYEKYSVTHEVPSYFNIFDCGGDLLNGLDVTYEQACMSITKEKYYTKMLETLVDYNDRKMQHCPMRIFDKQSVNSWQNQKRNNLMPNVMPIM